MPKQKDLKRLVRSRMQKTGESYTAARAHLVEKRSQRAPVTKSRALETRVAGTQAVAAERKVADFAKLAGMSDDTIHAKTGRTWKEWVNVLDAIGATKMAHRDIARHVNEVLEIGGWWSQTVTVGYERIRGLRDIGQRRGGSYEATKSKTFPVAVGTLFDAFSTASGRKRWLAGEKIIARKATAGKSVRLTWSDGTSVEVWLTPKGPEKTQAAVQHRKLATKAEAEKRKKYWGERLDVLAQVLGAVRARGRTNR
ncbi:MAG TPA: hypothetical protein VFD07_09170 [Candidatus Krumholzibacteria bacterium]|nr:hypothetical protein [Candidatus Krumholzibacteria bacterium]